MKKRVLVSLALMVACAAPVAFAQAAAAPAAAPAPVIKYIAAAVAVGLATLGGGIAVGQIGAAAMAAMSENPDLSGKALPFVGLAEGICLWGFIVALMILSA
ncbi:MAG: ATP synthase subunit C [Spirochaetia bacterium]